MDPNIIKEEDNTFYSSGQDHPLIFSENSLDDKTDISNQVTLKVDPNTMCIKEELCSEEADFKIEYFDTEVKDELPVKSDDIEIEIEEKAERSPDCETEKNQCETLNKNDKEVYYKCDKCDHRTTRKSGLKSHSLTHMDPSEVTLYKCNVCPYASKFKASLKVHTLTHKSITETISNAECKTEINQVGLQQKIDTTFLKLIGGAAESDDDKLQADVDNKNVKDIIDKSRCDFADISLSEPIITQKIHKRKAIRCKFCNKDITTNNFTRHLQRHHAAETEIRNILRYPKNSKERRHALVILRNYTHFNLYENGVTRPVHQKIKGSSKDVNYYPCARCKGLYVKEYLRRHSRTCVVQTKDIFQNRKNDKVNPQTATASESKMNSKTSKLSISSFSKSKETPSEVKKDELISHFGESYLEKQKVDMAYTCNSRIKELTDLLTTYQRNTGDDKASLKDLLLPSKFSTIVCTVRDLAGYDPLNNSFQTPSVVVNLRTSLKHTCEELIHLIEEESEGFETNSVDTKEKWLNDVKKFIDLVDTHWSTELASIMNKNTQGEIWTSLLKSPLMTDVETCIEKYLQVVEEEVPTSDMREQLPLKNETRKILKRSWTDEDVELLNSEFGQYIKKGVYPSGKEIGEFIKKYNVNRKIAVVKSKIQHIINLNKKRKPMKH